MKYGPGFSRRALALRSRGKTYKQIAAALGMPVSGYLIVRQIILGTHWSVRSDV